jgi:hypothetical protein
MKADVVDGWHPADVDLLEARRERERLQLVWHESCRRTLGVAWNRAIHPRCGECKKPILEEKDTT